MFYIADALILADNVESAVLTLVEKMSKEFHSFAFSQRSVGQTKLGRSIK
jgi:hypothetical protein